MTSTPQIVDLNAFTRESGHYGTIFAFESADLDFNLVYFDKGEGVPHHVNDEVDVAGVVLRGEGALALDGIEYRLRPGHFFFIPKGSARGLRSTRADFVYLSFHVRRSGLMPE
ncbi:MAG: cupin domain-containing protein [Chloroflexi bacterium]|nr:cupin domain-containing protein [Chloroflexota bacterium]MBI3762050.1 cupin domain-containing protein [Chloroflexota bacterium]